eukprot:6173105-Pleurochrysis_carterae.AAC.2
MAAPCRGWYEPAGTVKHAVDPSLLLKVPVLHGNGVVDAAALKVPAGHGTAYTDPSGQKKP